MASSELNDSSVPFARVGKNCCLGYNRLETGCVYILDDQKLLPGDIIDEIHPQKCDAIRQFFEKSSPYKVKSVPPQRDQKGFTKYWTNELSEKGDNELTIVYFHGTFGGNGGKLAL